MNERIYKNRKIIISIFFKMLIIIFGILGIYFALKDDDFTTLDVLNFFTIQTNIAIILLSAVFLVLEILQLILKKNLVHKILLYIKFAFTVEITLTFLMFFTVIAPFTQLDFAFNIESIFTHLVVPSLSISEFFLFYYNIKLSSKSAVIYSLIFPLCYFIYITILINFGVTFFGAGAPYYFFDYKTLGWFSFSENGPGTFYWVLFLMGVVVGLSILYKRLIILRQKSADKSRKTIEQALKTEKKPPQDEAAATKDSRNSKF